MIADPATLEALRREFKPPVDASPRAWLNSVTGAVSALMSSWTGGGVLAGTLFGPALDHGPQAWGGVGTDGVLLAAHLQAVTPPGRSFLPVVQLDAGEGTVRGPRFSGLASPGQPPIQLALVVPVLVNPLSLVRALGTAASAGHRVVCVAAVVVTHHCTARHSIDVALGNAGATLVHITTADLFEDGPV